jgi:hypothetical protein
MSHGIIIQNARQINLYIFDLGQLIGILHGPGSTKWQYFEIG